YAMQMSAMVSLLTVITNVIILLGMYLMRLSGMTSLVGIAILHAFSINIPFLVASVFVFAFRLEKARPNLKYYDKEKAKDVLGMGFILLWLQIATMFVACSHSIIITQIVNPESVSEFNVYYKLYNGVASVLALVLVPIWSEVTKAKAEKDYQWIIQLQKKLHYLLLVSIVVFIVVSICLQFVFDIWLRENTYYVTLNNVVALSAFSIIFVWHNINTSIANGLSEFKTQNVCMLCAVVLFVPFSLLLYRIIGTWTAVLYASCICMLPYEMIQPFMIKKYLYCKENDKNDTE
ncbi:MAG: hypothetical protein K5895_11155, partial [Lachnospiraceae bacterium]|nr:hypothetical protein [Lachnospiraceae bacterium]